MNYTAMTLASPHPSPSPVFKDDPHGAHISFATFLLIAGVIFLVIKFFPGGRK